MTCQNCHYKLSYKETLNLGLVPRVGIKCPNCDAQQYFTAESRRKGMLFALILIILFTILALLNISLPIRIGIGFIFIVGFILFYPLTVQLSSEEEPLW